MKAWLSTKDAMNILGVTSTTVKRWADEGRLKSRRTAGGHRRFLRADVTRVANAHIEHDPELPEIENWVQRLTASTMREDLSGEITELQDRLGNWFETADFLGRVLDEIGIGWANGALSTVEEHIATSRLRFALVRLSAMGPSDDDTPVCTLVSLEEERHDLGLYLAELCLKKSGYETTFIGPDTPLKDLVEFILENEQRIVGVSASQWSTDYGSLMQAYAEISAACRTQGTELILGGKGAWPGDLEYGHRCPRFVDLPDILKSIA